MPRANRHFLPGYVWHITHRCHQRKVSAQVCARATPLFALALRSEEEIRSVRARLHRHIQSRSSSNQRYRVKRHCREHAAHRRVFNLPTVSQALYNSDTFPFLETRAMNGGAWPATSCLIRGSALRKRQPFRSLEVGWTSARRLSLAPTQLPFVQ